MTDPITDMFNQIRNAKSVAKTEVVLPLSNIKYEIAKILAKSNFVTEVKKTTKGKLKVLKIVLKYDDGVSAITDMRRVSKPGQRIYAKTSEIKRVKGGYGMSIISTPKGLMTNTEARKAKLGGEVICEVW